MQANHEPRLDVEAAVEHAHKEGYEAGKAAGSWVVNGNTSAEAADRLLRGLFEGDPEVMDGLPSSPLSGEWAGAPLPRDVLAAYGMSEDDGAADDVLRAYEDGYAAGVVEQVEHDARVACPMISTSYPAPIAYTYVADHHCPECAARAFGVDPHGTIPEWQRDSENNPIGAVAPWSEWVEPTEPGPQSLVCGTCGNIIETWKGDDDVDDDA